jgi:hypothetical protein
MPVTKTNFDDIDNFIASHFRPGEEVDLYLGLPKPLTEEEVIKLETNLRSQGIALTAPLDYGSTKEWASAVRLRFTAPDYSGVGTLPLAVMLVLAVGAVGIASFLGYKIGNVVDAIAKYTLPIVLIGAGTFIMWAYITKGERRS